MAPSSILPSEILPPTILRLFSLVRTIFRKVFPQHCLSWTTSPADRGKQILHPARFHAVVSFSNFTHHLLPAFALLQRNKRFKNQFSSLNTRRKISPRQDCHVPLIPICLPSPLENFLHLPIFCRPPSRPHLSCHAPFDHRRPH